MVSQILKSANFKDNSEVNRETGTTSKEHKGKAKMNEMQEVQSGKILENDEHMLKAQVRHTALPS